MASMDHTMPIEPPLRLLTPDGRWAIDVSETEGRFTATVILDGITIIESLTTDDSDKVITWTSRQMREVMRRQTHEAKEEKLGPGSVDPV